MGREKSGRLLTPYLDYSTAVDRMLLANDAAQHLLFYKASRLKLQNSARSGPRLTDLAYDAESSFRVLGKVALDSLNDLNDSGVLELLFDSASPNPSVPIQEAMTRGVQYLTTQEGLQDVDPRSFDELFKTFRRYSVSAATEKRLVTITFQKPGEKVRKVRIRAHPKPGDLGRLGSREFFTGTKRITSPAPTPTDPDGHHGLQAAASIGRVDNIALYDLFVLSLNFGTHAMYRHARFVERFGKAHLSGAHIESDFETTIASILGAFAGFVNTIVQVLVCAVGNADDGSGGICDSDSLMAGLTGAISGFVGVFIWWGYGKSETDSSTETTSEGLSSQQQDLITMGA